MDVQAQPAQSDQIHPLSEQETALIAVSALTSVGDLLKLDSELRLGLDAGLTISQLRAALEQLYAYCGFPRSLNGINTLRAVIEDRTRQGIHDQLGDIHVPIAGGDRYERGRVTLEILTGVPQAKPASGFGEFSTEIDRFLKEHLFADIFDNQILTSRERELVTIAALTSMRGVESQLKAHVGMGRNVGITDAELIQLADLIEKAVSRTQANGLRKLLGQAEQPVIEKDMLVRISEITIAPEAREKYLSILKAQAQKSVASEPGVVSIFPIVLSDDDSQVRIVEIYKNRAAYEAHIASPHFQHYKTSTLQMVTSLKLLDMTVLDGDTMQMIFEKLR